MEPPDSGAFHRFCDSPLWALQRRYFEHRGVLARSEGDVSRETRGNPSVARSYAEVVLSYVRDLARSAALDSAEPLYVVEFGAGCGRFAHHFLSEFLPMLKASLVDAPVCYVMTDLVQATVDAWLVQPKLRRHMLEGTLELARFDAERDDRIRLEHGGRTLAPGTLRNPVVVIANHFFGSIPQDLFVLEDGTIREGWMRLEQADGAPLDPQQVSDAHPFGGVQMSYEARAPAGLPLLDPRWRALLEEEARGGRHGAVLLPRQAFGALARVRALHNRGGMLLLATDRGVDATLTAGSDVPGFEVHGGVSLPVDLSVLGQALGAEGREVWLGGQPGAFTFLAAAVGNDADLSETDRSVRDHLIERSPSDFQTLTASLRAAGEFLDPEEVLELVRLGRWDDGLFSSCLPELRRRIATAPSRLQAQWSAALDTLWDRHLPLREARDLAFELGTVAARMEYWAQAARLFQLSVDVHGPHPSSLHNLAMAWWQLARHDVAERELGRAHELASEDPIHAERLQALRSIRARCVAVLGADTLALNGAEAGDVCATVLGPHHAPALHRQQDAEIEHRAGVERLTSVADARRWIAEQRSEPKRTTLAVVERERGLVGAIGVTRTGDAAGFYYWIAARYRRRGYGHRAVALLRAFAQRCGVVHLRAPVRRDNLASRRVLERAGFASGGVAPDDRATQLYELNISSTEA